MTRPTAPTTTVRAGSGLPHRGDRLKRWPGLHLASHRASSATLAGAYPFLVAAPPPAGVPIGVDALTGEPFVFDPWAAYEDGTVTNPNVALAGVIGVGKSALVKSLTLRSIAVGRRVYVPGDPKGEWASVADAVGGLVVALGPGMPARLNPLNTDTLDPVASHQVRARLLVALAGTTLGRDLTPLEHSALDAALSASEHDHSTVLIGHVVDALLDPDPTAARADRTTSAQRALDGRDLAASLRRLIRGDLAGLFDRPSTVHLDPAAPMVVLDLSRLGSDDAAVAVAMSCTSAWLESALSSTAGQRWVVYDEAWRLMRQVALVRRMQAQWKLSRAYGIANMLVRHRLSDADATGPAGSEARALADGLLADCSTRIVYRQESDQLATTARALGLSTTERDLLPVLPRGTGLWKLPAASYVVHHVLHPDEVPLVDTDAAMRTPAPGET